MDARQSFGEVSFFTKRFCKFWFVGSALPQVNSKTVFSKTIAIRHPSLAQRGANINKRNTRATTCGIDWHKGVEELFEESQSTGQSLNIFECI